MQGPGSSSSVLTTSPCGLLVHSQVTATSHPAPRFSEEKKTGRGERVQKPLAVQELKIRAIFPFSLELSPELIKTVINFSRSLHVVFVSDFQCFSCAHRINY